MTMKVSFKCLLERLNRTTSVRESSEIAIFWVFLAYWQRSPKESKSSSMKKHRTKRESMPSTWRKMGNKSMWWLIITFLPKIKSHASRRRMETSCGWSYLKKRGPSSTDLTSASLEEWPTIPLEILQAHQLTSTLWTLMMNKTKTKIYGISFCRLTSKITSCQLVLLWTTAIREL